MRIILEESFDDLPFAGGALLGTVEVPAIAEPSKLLVEVVATLPVGEYRLEIDDERGGNVTQHCAGEAQTCWFVREDHVVSGEETVTVSLSRTDDQGEVSGQLRIGLLHEPVLTLAAALSYADGTLVVSLWLDRNGVPLPLDAWTAGNVEILNAGTGATVATYLAASGFTEVGRRRSFSLSAALGRSTSFVVSAPITVGGATWTAYAGFGRL